ncbi:MAG: TIGR00296 family protein [Nanoarchaeota archaeon]|nr:TIGR00296 family protein [Nanoarchaeota archaeon]
MLNDEQKRRLLKIARESILDPEFSIREFPEKRGVFVTLHKPDGELRGCIGFPNAAYSLGESVTRASRLAAYEDFRFEPLSKDEEFLVEISVLTEPELIEVRSSDEYLDKIEIGKDGLIIKGINGSGLLLPQVASEWKWDVKEFLENLCVKAGLSRGAWREMKNEVYKFQAEVFSEQV